MLEDHQIVVVLNYGPFALRPRWGGNAYTIPAATPTGNPDSPVSPGRGSMPWHLAKREFGDPTTADIDPSDPYKKFRAQELGRLNTQFGLLDAPMYTERPSYTGEAQPDKLEPQPFHGPDEIGTTGYHPHPDFEGWFRHPNLPLVEVRTDDTNERIFMVIDDPTGDHARGVEANANMRTVVETDNARIQTLERQLADLRDQISNRADVAAEGTGEIPADSEGLVAGGVSMDEVRPEPVSVPVGADETVKPAATSPARPGAKKAARVPSRG